MNQNSGGKPWQKLVMLREQPLGSSLGVSVWNLQTIPISQTHHKLAAFSSLMEEIGPELEMEIWLASCFVQLYRRASSLDPGGWL